MKLTRALAASLGLATILTTTPATAAEVELTADLASAYVFRGATYNDGAVLQPSLSASGFKLGEFEIPLTFSVWGNMDLEKVEADVTDDAGNVVGTETEAESGRFSEVDLSVSLALPTVVEGLGWSIGFTDYLYPQAGGESDREVSLSFEVDTLLAPTLAVYYPDFRCSTPKMTIFGGRAAESRHNSALLPAKTRWLQTYPLYAVAGGGR